METAHHSHWVSTHLRLVFLVLLLAIDVVLLVVYQQHQPHPLIVAFLNIGQGDAVYIEAPNGNQLLYDAGPPTGAVLSELAKVMPFYDRSIDVAVLSHPDLDHIGGFVDVFAKYKVDVLLESGASSTNGVYGVIKQRAGEQHVHALTLKRGMVIDMGDGVTADILYPDVDTTNMETNSASIVMHLRYGSTSFLLSGDLPISEEGHVVALNGSGLHAEVLKLGHHGSRTSSSELWLRSVSPSVTVASAGKDNRYGHPHKEVVRLLEKLGIPLLVTFEEGTIVFESDGHSVVRK